MLPGTRRARPASRLAIGEELGVHVEAGAEPPAAVEGPVRIDVRAERTAVAAEVGRRPLVEVDVLEPDVPAVLLAADLEPGVLPDLIRPRLKAEVVHFEARRSVADVQVTPRALSADLAQAHSAAVPVERRPRRVVVQMVGIRPLKAVHVAPLDPVDGLGGAAHVTACPVAAQAVPVVAEAPVAVDRADERRAGQKQQFVREAPVRARHHDAQA